MKVARAAPAFALLLAVSFAVALPAPGSAHLSLVRAGWESGGVAESQARLGEAVATGDFDGDGYEDLASAGPEAPNGNALPGTGQVIVNYGSSFGLTHEGATTLLFDTSDGNQRFGHALAAGDFNGDGRSDLAVGSPRDDIGSIVDAGRVNVYPGSAGGLAILPGQSLTQESAGQTSSSSGLFGWALAAGRFNDDAYDDLAISAIGATGNTGAVFVFHGSATGLSSAGVVLRANQLGHSLTPGESFGRALAAGDMIQDGRDDLAIGVPLHDEPGVTSAGRVHVVPGSAAGLTTTGALTLDAGYFQLTADPLAFFGLSLTVGQFLRGAGKLDLAVGEPGRRSGTFRVGRVTVVHLDSPQAGQDEFVTLPFGQFQQSGEDFGTALAAGDMDSDGDDELAVGMPDRISLEGATSGHVRIYSRLASTVRDSTTDLDAQILHDVNEDGWGFGEALAFGHFDGTGHDQLAVGAPGADFRVWPRMDELGLTPAPRAGQVHVYAPWRQPLSLQTRSGASLNCGGQLVFSQRPFDPLEIASTTKIMTLLLAAEAIQSGAFDSTDTYVIGSWIDDCFEGSNSDLREGEEVSLIDLMRLAIYQSGGDACMAIAALLTGEVDPFPVGCPGFGEGSICDPGPVVQPTFVSLMNQRASQLGMTGTLFTNTHGSRFQSCLGGDRHHSTALDMAKLGRAAMQNPLLASLVGIQTYSILRPFLGSTWIGTYGFLASLRERTEDRAEGIKPGSHGDGGWARHTGVGAIAPPLVLAVPPVSSVFGAPSGEIRNAGLGRMLELVFEQCSGVGPGSILPPPPDPPEPPIIALPDLPTESGRRTGAHAALEEPFEDLRVELHPGSMATGPTEAQLVVAHQSLRFLDPGEIATFGIEPFGGHDGILIRNVGPAMTYQVTLTHPSSVFTLALGPGEESLLPAQPAGNPSSFRLTVRNDDRSTPALLHVHELGYRHEVSLDPNDPFVSTLERDGTGEVDYEMLFLTLVGEDPEPGRTATLLARGAGSLVSVDPPDDPSPVSGPIASLSSFPNPMSSSTTIQFTLAVPAAVDLSIFDVGGRLVRRLERGPRQGGLHRVVWDGRSDAGDHVDAGIYFVRVSAGRVEQRRRIVLLR